LDFPIKEGKEEKKVKNPRQQQNATTGREKRRKGSAGLTLLNSTAQKVWG